MNLLRTAWQLWKKIGQFIGDFIARIILTIFYFTLFLPFGLVVRLFMDPLDIKGNREELWAERSTGDKVIDDARRLS